MHKLKTKLNLRRDHQVRWTIIDLNYFIHKPKVQLHNHIKIRALHQLVSGSILRSRIIFHLAKFKIKDLDLICNMEIFCKINRYKYNE